MANEPFYKHSLEIGNGDILDRFIAATESQKPKQQARPPPPTSPTSSDSLSPQISATTTPSNRRQNVQAALGSSSDRSSGLTGPPQRQRSTRSSQLGTTPLPRSTSSTCSSTNSPETARSKPNGSTKVPTRESPPKDPKRSSPTPKSTN